MREIILEYLQSDKKIKTLTDTGELVEDAVYAATVEQNSDTLNCILKWSQSNKTRKFTNRGRSFSGRNAKGNFDFNFISPPVLINPLMVDIIG